MTKNNNSESLINQRIGENFITNEKYKVVIIEYISSKKIKIKFDCGYEKYVEYSQLMKGNIKNPYHPSIEGVGYIGVGKYKCKKDGKVLKVYTIWSSMVRRCYSKKQQEKQPTYKGCSVDKNWHNFQVFAEWYGTNYKEGFHLDKDILIKDNKIYSPETCCFVPQEINQLILKSKKSRGNLPIGVYKSGKKYAVHFNMANKLVNIGTFNTIEEAFQAYKITKESYIKEVADKWKDRIAKQCYNALINYEIEITD